MTRDLILKKLKLERMPRRFVAFVLAALAVLAAATAVGLNVASARDDVLVGDAVTDKQMTVLIAAAGSCPTLTPARLAGQLMAESGLDDRAARTVSGGQGIAGLEDDKWQAWKPWPDARRSDMSANILALAHQMCDLTGHLRLAGAAGDQWRLAVAAFHVGLNSVAQVRGVPDTATTYVDRVSAYAGYYSKLRQFGGPGEVDRTAPAAEAKGVPAEYVQHIVRAGSLCQEVTPPLVAAHIMAQSGFDANRLGATGQRGVAQFRPDMWQAYGPKGRSVWEPEVAVPTMGYALCSLVRELSGLKGDPLQLALAAYRNGTTAVRQNGGTIDRQTETFLRSVKTFTDVYALDSRLTANLPTSPSPSPTPSPSGSPSPSPDASPSGSPSPSSPSTAGANAGAPPPPPAPDPKPTRPADAVQILNVHTKRCVSAGSGGDGMQLKLRTCTEDPAQWWTFRSDGTIRARGLCMDIAWGGSEDNTVVQAATCSGNPAQHWQMNSKGRIVSKLNGKVLDVILADPDKPLIIFTDKGYADQNWRKQ
ncbi:ricin-type beta-trefoil lectin domain protein [Verrucosispora sp. TAA-831]|uniref:ricin-type beta-trefoil lectin domain protein n=1 Tax=Verrucosispora sp. TAA-831 TaxID=3422227 RepID=UPI003D6F6559